MMIFNKFIIPLILKLMFDGTLVQYINHYNSKNYLFIISYSYSYFSYHYHKYYYN